MDNSQVAHIWAQQRKSSAKGSNFYFEGATIYSYGAHFPIARFTYDAHGKYCVLFTTRGYSVTTSKHIGYVRQALYGLDIPRYYVSNPGNNPSSSDLETLKKRAIACLQQAASARSRKEPLLAEARGYENDYFTLAKAFKLSTDGKRKLFSTAQINKIQRDAIVSKIKARQDAKIRAQERAQEIKIARAEWITKKRDYVPHDAQMPVMLRMKDESTIETSRGAQVPVNVAKALYERFKSQPDAINGPGRIDIGEFTINRYQDGNVIIGCHSIPWVEIERFFSSLA